MEPEEKAVQRLIDKMPAFMHPEFERIETLDDLLYLTGVEIDIAKGGGMDPPWTPKQFARAKAYEQTVEAVIKARKKNPGIEANEWLPAHAVRFNVDGTVSMMTESAEKNSGPTVRTVWAVQFKQGKKWVDSGYGWFSTSAEAMRLAEESGQEWRVVRVKPAPRLENLTDRALRYRANADPPPGEKICAFCGSTRFVEVGHIDGHEEHNEPENLIWNCRQCNTRMGIAFRDAGIGRRTHQYNPTKSGGAKTLGEWMQAVGAITPHRGAKYAARRYGIQSDMSTAQAVAMIRATPAWKRSEFARELRKHGGGRRRSEVPF